MPDWKFTSLFTTLIIRVCPTVLCRRTKADRSLGHTVVSTKSTSAESIEYVEGTDIRSLPFFSDELPL